MRPLVALPLINLLAACCAAGLAVSDPFQHAAWLVAYLFLVGFLAQLLLARGYSALAADGLARGGRSGAQLLLWNVGTVLVPAGVLVEMRLGVVLGGVALLGALVAYLPGPRAMRTRRVTRAWLREAHLALVAFMAVSVLIGTGLAWDTSWV